jgi:hypothetical protein
MGSVRNWALSARCRNRCQCNVGHFITQLFCADNAIPPARMRGASPGGPCRSYQNLRRSDSTRLAPESGSAGSAEGRSLIAQGRNVPSQVSHYGNDWRIHRSFLFENLVCALRPDIRWGPSRGKRENRLLGKGGERVPTLDELRQSRVNQCQLLTE